MADAHKAAGFRDDRARVGPGFERSEPALLPPAGPVSSAGIAHTRRGRATSNVWSAVTCHRFATLAACRQSRAASRGPGELDALPHSTATSRLPKARTSSRTPKSLRLL